VTTAAGTLLDRRLRLDDRVALRPEPFGALAYHYGNRKLIFLKHPDVVRVVRALDGTDTLAATLRACAIAESRWPSFVAALTSLTESEMLHECEPVASG
jgi:putative mycofactocin binding protein MftB